MAAAAKRDACAAKLEDSIRQLRRYLDVQTFSSRILQLKCDKIEVDREELLSKHHYYGERSSIDLDNPEMTTFIAPRIDAAVDIVDEAILIMENLNQEETREKLINSNRDSAQKK